MTEVDSKENRRSRSGENKYGQLSGTVARGGCGVKGKFATTRETAYLHAERDPRVSEKLIRTTRKEKAGYKS